MQRIAYRLTGFAMAATLLCLPAIWNGFPLLFDDVGGYLQRWPTGTLGNGRSAAYGLLVWGTASSWWIPTIVLQAAATAWVVGRALQMSGLNGSPWALVGAVAALGATGGAALFASQVMPDAWAAPAALGFMLLACYADRLGRAERVAMTAIVGFAGAVHIATLGLLAGLSLLATAAWLLRARLRPALPGIGVANLAAWSGLVLLLAVNLALAGRVTMTPGGGLFLFSRLVEAGIVAKTLRQECPRVDWALCAFRDELPTTAGDFLWEAGSPLYKIGGLDDPAVAREIAAITARSLLAAPADHLASALAATAGLLLSLGAPDSMGRVESSHTEWNIIDHAPWLERAFERSRQQQGEIDLRAWSAWIVVPITAAGTVAVPMLAVLAWRSGRRREALLLAMVACALIGNAVLCGIGSGPHVRYQARLAWLAPFCATVALAAACRRRFENRAGDARQALGGEAPR